MNVEMMASKGKSERLLLSNVVDVYYIFVKNSKRDAQHQSDLVGEAQLLHLYLQQEAKTEMKNQEQKG